MPLIASEAGTETGRRSAAKDRYMLLKKKLCAWPGKP